MIAWLDGLLHAVGPAAYLILFLAALVEYVFPPFPGDTVTLMGGLYAVRGEKPWGLVFAAVTLGSVLGAALDYQLGAYVARRAREGRAALGFTRERVEALHASARSYGPWLLVLNRFMPAVRGAVFLGAGVAGMPFGRVMLLGTLSAAGWNVLLMAVGMALGGNAERLQAFVSRYNTVAYAVLGTLGVVLVARFAWRRRRQTGR